MTPSFETTAREIVGLIGNISNRPDLRDILLKQLELTSQALRQAHVAGLEEGMQICAEERTTARAMNRIRARAVQVRGITPEIRREASRIMEDSKILDEER